MKPMKPHRFCFSKVSLTKSGIDVCDSLVHGHVDEPSAQAEVREHKEAFLQALVEHQQRLTKTLR